MRLVGLKRPPLKLTPFRTYHPSLPASLSAAACSSHHPCGLDNEEYAQLVKRTQAEKESEVAKVTKAADARLQERTQRMDVEFQARLAERDGEWQSQVEMVKNRGQVLFCWTDDQNNPEIVKHLKNLGVDGIICDRFVLNNCLNIF
jgi:glycerophosphoryl diester phosphodiesterase